MRRRRLQHWVCENAKTTRAFLKRVDAVCTAGPAAAGDVDRRAAARPRKGGDEADRGDVAALLAPALQGHDLGLLSRSGPAGARRPGGVARSRRRTPPGVRVVALPGASAIALALAASGMNGQSFAFVGYVPQDAAARAQRLRELEALALRTGQTQLLIETPYRNAALWQGMLQALKPATRLAFASGLTLPAGACRSAQVSAWKQQGMPVTNDVPAVFVIGA